MKRRARQVGDALIYLAIASLLAAGVFCVYQLLLVWWISK